MKCTVCENDAHAVCQLCGRAVCKQHIREKEFISGFRKKTLMQFKEPGVRVKDAVWCGQCHPEYQDGS